MGASRDARAAWMQALPFIALVAACIGPTAEERPGGSHPNLPVVDDVGPFDPSEAVDDDDEELAPFDVDKDPSDDEAFADEPEPDEPDRNEAQDAGALPADTAEAPSPEGRASAPSSAASPENPTEAAPPEVVGDAGENERAKDGELSPPGESIATPEQAQRLVESRERELARSEQDGRDDDEVKVEIARNPPAEPIPRGKGMAWTLLDYVFETLLVVLAAAALTFIPWIARRHPRWIAGLALALALVAGFMWSQVG